MYKKILLGSLLFSTLNADISKMNYLEADNLMNWRDGMHYCSQIYPLGSFTLPNHSFMKTLSDKDKALLDYKNRYWLNEFDNDFNTAKAYGIYPYFRMDFITMSKEHKARILCLEKKILSKK